MRRREEGEKDRRDIFIWEGRVVLMGEVTDGLTD
jgi:hypothetical protein